MAEFRDSVEQNQNGGGGATLAGGGALASSWRLWSGLLAWEDRQLDTAVGPALLHWLHTLQHYTQKQNELNVPRGALGEQQQLSEVQLLSFTCIALLLGRIPTRHVAERVAPMRPQLLAAIFTALRSAEGDALLLAAHALRVVVLAPLREREGERGREEEERRGEVEALLPPLLEMMDAPDAAARVAVELVADLVSLQPRHLEVLLQRLHSPVAAMRRNVLEAVGGMLKGGETRRKDFFADSRVSERVAKHLLQLLGDEDMATRVQASALLVKLDPPLVLPSLLPLLHADDGRVRSAATNALSVLFKEHPDTCQLLSTLLDALQSQSLSAEGGDSHSVRSPSSGNSLERVTGLLPHWAERVADGDWPAVVDLLLNRMWLDPANPVLPAVLSKISRQLAERAHLVLPRVAAQMAAQRNLSEEELLNLSATESEGATWQGSMPTSPLARETFSRLSPLLVLKVLPLSVFSAAENVWLYGPRGNGGAEKAADSIFDLLLERVCGVLEFESIRKLAAELLGRMLPQVLLPRMAAELEGAVAAMDDLKAKALLFTICTSLMVREREALMEPWMGRIRAQISLSLLRPCPPPGEREREREGEWEATTELAKLQHGCIDCLAIMIRTELLGNVKSSDFRMENGTAPNSVEVEEKQERDALGKGTDHHSMRAENSRNSPQRGSAEGRREDREVLREGFYGKQGQEDSAVRRSPLIVELGEEREEGGGRVCEGEELKQEGAFSESVRETGVKEIGLTGRAEENAVECSELDEGDEGRSGRRVEGGEKERERRRPLIEEVELEKDLSHHSEDILAAVITCLTDDPPNIPFICDLETAPLSFQMCMANVLISANQKASPSAQQILARRIVPPLMRAAECAREEKIRSACLQVLFISAHRLPAPAMLPHAADLLSLAVAAIRSRRSNSERLAGGKLLTALLASHDSVVAELLPCLPEVALTVRSAARLDSSPDLRALCAQLAACLPPHGGGGASEGVQTFLNLKESSCLGRAFKKRGLFSSPVGYK